MRKVLPAAAVLAVAALTLGACNNPNDDVAANTDTMADTAATMPADNTLTPGMTTNTTVNADGSVTTTNPDGTTTTTGGVTTNTATNTTTNTTY